MNTDQDRFGHTAAPILRRAAAELSWLLDRGYPDAATLKLVGDRHTLDARQRDALRRSTCTTAARADRLDRRLTPAQLQGQPLHLDGFNVLTTVEAALSGDVLLRGLDGVMRDLRGLHRRPRERPETLPALARIASALERLGVTQVVWWLDQPVPHSGAMRGLIQEQATAWGQQTTWSVELVHDPDPVLIEQAEPVVSADARILDGGGPWFDLASAAIEGLETFEVDFRPSELTPPGDPAGADGDA